MSPESGDVEHIYAELISIAMKESIIGKPVDPEKYKHIAEFIRLKFFVIDPLGKRLTLRDVLNQVEILERMHNIKIDTITIDPLNYLDINTYGDRDDVAQGKDLDLFLADAKSNSRHNCIITHVRDIKSREIKIGKDVIGHYKPMPTPFDVANGQMFYRKGFGMLATWRPLDTDRNPLTDDFGNEYPKNTLIIDVQKIKPKGTGELGRFSLYYDASKNCFYEAGKRYSWQYKEK
jgi:hypothetical protein